MTMSDAVRGLLDSKTDDQMRVLTRSNFRDLYPDLDGEDFDDAWAEFCDFRDQVL